MSYKSGFFDAQDLGEGDFDRVYSSADLAHYFSLLVGNGVFPKPSNSLQVSSQSSPNMSIKIAPGSGWINGYFITVTAEETLAISTAHASLPRIDSILMRLNLSTREIQLVVSRGTASSSPQPGALIRTGNYYDLELAQVRVSAGATSITQSVIQDMRHNSTRCGIVTGLIDQIDATGLFSQYQAQFNTWFENLQTQLSGDVAGNLQNQINSIPRFTVLWEGEDLPELTTIEGMDTFNLFAIKVGYLTPRSREDVVIAVKDPDYETIQGSGIFYIPSSPGKFRQVVVQLQKDYGKWSPSSGCLYRDDGDYETEGFIRVIGIYGIA